MKLKFNVRNRSYSRIKIGILFGAIMMLAPISLAIDIESAVSSENIHLGQSLYQSACAHCHDGGGSRAPSKSVFLLGMSPQRVYNAITDGVMKNMASHLSEQERKILAQYLTRSELDLSQSATARKKIKCSAQEGWFEYDQGISVSGWGINGADNVRSIQGQTARLSISEVKQLKLKWAFEYPNATNTRSQPAIAGGALFVGSHDGSVYALDAKTGCMHWVFQADAEVRSAISVAPIEMLPGEANFQPPLIYFGDRAGNAYAVQATSGQLQWKVRVDTHKQAFITGSPTLHEGRLYVPVSSMEETIGGDSRYSCCTFRGSVVALDAKSGKKIWQTFTIEEEASPTHKNAIGVQQYGPSGAAVYTSPTIDHQRGRLYIGTDNNYSSPATTSSNAIFAINLSDGSIEWMRQMSGGNVYNSSCKSDKVNCPDEYEKWGNWGFAAAPILVSDRKKGDVLVAGQKSGMMWGIEPSSGELLWQTRLTNEGMTVGPYLGIAAQAHRVFATVSQKLPLDKPFPEIKKLGMYALDVRNGKIIWSAPVDQYCKSRPCMGYTSAPTSIPGVVFNGANDGYLRAFNSTTGELLWEVNTNRKFITLNGSIARGGAFEGAGPVIVDGMLYISSGYGQNRYSIPGNVLLAYSIGGQ